MFDPVGVGALVEAAGPLGRVTREDVVPVLPALRPLLPGGLRPGAVVCADAGTLRLALVAGASKRGAWCAAVGLPELGVLAAAEMGVEPERLLLVDEPGRRWPDVAAALIDAVDLVVIRPQDRPGPTLARRLTALARRGRCVLVVAGDWPGAQLRLRVDAAEWTGLGDGHGHLRGRRARVVATGRGAAEPGRHVWLWLPGPDGAVSAAEAPARALEVVA